MDASIAVIGLVVLVVVLVVLVRPRAPKTYPVIHEEQTINGVNVVKCSNCGQVLGEKVDFQSAFGSRVYSDSSVKYYSGGQEICPHCGVKVKR